MVGEEINAIAILRNIIPKSKNPHIVDIIAARIPYCKPIILDSCKLAYYNIPKCGSSSIKDAILIAAGRSPKKETSHFHVAEFETFLSFRDIDEKYSEYSSFAIIRSPAERLRSYWQKNVVESQSLFREARGQSKFYGLDTLPSYGVMLRNFFRYRQVFIDFRHHTDSIVGYLGNTLNRIEHVFNVSDTSAALTLIGNASGVEIPFLHNMRSNQPVAINSHDMVLEDEIVASAYNKEQVLLGEMFR